MIVLLTSLMLSAAQPADGPYFVRRIVITGNTVTSDEVVRRELGLAEGAVFDMGALVRGIDRLNQHGYFKPIDEHHVKVAPTPGAEGLVDVEVIVEEQRRVWPSFGGGTSQNGGVLGSVSFSTPNLFGRGRTLSLLAERGAHDSRYQASVTDPHLFNGAITGSITLSSENILYTSRADGAGYAESRNGGTVAVARSVAPFARVSFAYTYEAVDSAGPIGSGRHADGRLASTFTYDTVDDPFLPHRGVRFAAGLQIGGPVLGGTDTYVKPELAAVWYRPTSRRTGFGLRGEAGAITTFGDTTATPYYLRFFLGGENQIRGVDFRTVGPLDSAHRVLGGTSFVLFNAEYHIDLSRRVRVVAFHDAGQAFDEANRFSVADLRSSTGLELRVVVPKLNLPLRFIYYWNGLKPVPYDGVSRDSFQPAHGFRFAIGAAF